MRFSGRTNSLAFWGIARALPGTILCPPGREGEGRMKGRRPLLPRRPRVATARRIHIAELPRGWLGDSALPEPPTGRLARLAAGRVYWDDGLRWGRDNQGVRSAVLGIAGRAAEVMVRHGRPWNRRARHQPSAWSDCRPPQLTGGDDEI